MTAMISTHETVAENGTRTPMPSSGVRDTVRLMPADTGAILTALHEAAVRAESVLAPKLEEARAEKRRLVLAAKEAGIPATLIATVLGVSSARAYSIIESAKGKPKKK